MRNKTEVCRLTKEEIDVKRYKDDTVVEKSAQDESDVERRTEEETYRDSLKGDSDRETDRGWRLMEEETKVRD
jgi:hypothetical protein